MRSQLHLTPAKGLIRLGHIQSPQGLGGLVRIYSETSKPQDICAYGPLWDANKQRQFTLKFIRMHKNHLICEIEAIHDRTEAEKLQGIMLCIEKDRLPQLEDDEYYYEDLTGLKVVNMQDQELGYVKAVQDFGGGSMLDVMLETERRSIYIPFTENFVPEVDIKAGFVRCNPSEDMFEPVSSGSRRRRPS